MKQWTKQDLTLFYYDELTPKQRQSLTNAMTADETLKLEYEALSRFLDTSVELEVPQPDMQLNQRIMAGIYQQAEFDKANTIGDAIKVKQSFNLFSNWQRFVGTAAVGLLVVMSTFYLGRLSVDVEPVTASLSEQSNSIDQQIDSTEKNTVPFAGKRVLLKNLSLHLQATDRLLTQVSNNSNSVVLESESRQQALDEMLSLNRLYRRMAESYQDKQLANVLQQMEQVLLSLKHTDQLQDQKGWEQLRSRIDNNDLLFRMRVTNRALEPQSI